ncbi:MAG: hypothetical protein AABX10_02780 [Nanoarchaeota archaeon]
MTNYEYRVHCGLIPVTCESIEFKPLSFPNPLNRGDSLSIRDIELGEIEEVAHEHDGNSAVSIVYLANVVNSDVFPTPGISYETQRGKIAEFLERIKPLNDLIAKININD